MSVKLQKLCKGRLKPIEEKRRRGLHGLHLQMLTPRHLWRVTIHDRNVHKKGGAIAELAYQV